MTDNNALHPSVDAVNAEKALRSEYLFQPSTREFAIDRYSEGGPIKNHPLHYHDAYELYYLYSGERYYIIGDNTYHVVRGNFVIIKPYETHITANYGKFGYDRFLISFRKSFIDKISEAMDGADVFRCFNESIQVITLDFTKQSLIESLLFSMLEEYNKKEEGYEAFLKTALIQLLLVLGRTPKTAPESSLKAIHKTVSAAVNYINEHYAEDITLSEICRKFFVSQSHFSRTFKRVTGIPFIKYLNGVRIKAAQQILKEENISISRVAERVGYSGTTHFGRIFKDITGISPYEYKRTKGRKQ